MRYLALLIIVFLITGCDTAPDVIIKYRTTVIVPKELKKIKKAETKKIDPNLNFAHPNNLEKVLLNSNEQVTELLKLRAQVKYLKKERAELERLKKEIEEEEEEKSNSEESDSK